MRSMVGDGFLGNLSETFPGDYVFVTDEKEGRWSHSSHVVLDCAHTSAVKSVVYYPLISLQKLFCLHSDRLTAHFQDSLIRLLSAPNLTVLELDTTIQSSDVKMLAIALKNATNLLQLGIQIIYRPQHPCAEFVEVLKMLPLKGLSLILVSFSNVDAFFDALQHGKCELRTLYFGYSSAFPGLNAVLERHAATLVSLRLFSTLTHSDVESFKQVFPRLKLRSLHLGLQPTATGSVWSQFISPESCPTLKELGIGLAPGFGLSTEAFNSFAKALKSTKIEHLNLFDSINNVDAARIDQLRVAENGWLTHVRGCNNMPQSLKNRLARNIKRHHCCRKVCFTFLSLKKRKSVVLSAFPKEIVQLIVFHLWELRNLRDWDVVVKKGDAIDEGDANLQSQSRCNLM